MRPSESARQFNVSPDYSIPRTLIGLCCFTLIWCADIPREPGIVQTTGTRFEHKALLNSSRSPGLQGGGLRECLAKRARERLP